MCTMVSLKDAQLEYNSFRLAGASIIGRVNSKATLTLRFSQLVDLSCDVSVHDVGPE